MGLPGRGGGSGRPLGDPWPAFGPSWRVFGPPRGCFGCRRGACGNGRAESSKKRPFGDVVRTMLEAFFYDLSCLFGASPALFFPVFRGLFWSLFSSCSSSFVLFCGSCGHALRTVKTNGFSCFSKLAKAAALPERGRACRENVLEMKPSKRPKSTNFLCFSWPRCLENGVVEKVTFGSRFWVHFRPPNGPKMDPKSLKSAP